MKCTEYFTSNSKMIVTNTQIFGKISIKGHTKSLLEFEFGKTRSEILIFLKWPRCHFEALDELKKERMKTHGFRYRKKKLLLFGLQDVA